MFLRGWTSQALTSSVGWTKTLGNLCVPFSVCAALRAWFGSRTVLRCLGGFLGGLRTLFVLTLSALAAATVLKTFLHLRGPKIIRASGQRPRMLPSAEAMKTIMNDDVSRGITVHAHLPPMVKIPILRGVLGNPHGELTGSRMAARELAYRCALSAGVHAIVDMGASPVTSVTRVVPPHVRLVCVQFPSLDGNRRNASDAGITMVGSEREAVSLLADLKRTYKSVATVFVDSGYYASEEFLVSCTAISEFTVVIDHIYATPVGCWKDAEGGILSTWTPHPDGGVMVRGPSHAYPNAGPSAPWAWRDGFMMGKAGVAAVHIVNETHLYKCAILRIPDTDLEVMAEQRIKKVNYTWSFTVPIDERTRVTFYNEAGSYTYRLDRSTTSAWLSDGQDAETIAIGTLSNNGAILTQAISLASRAHKEDTAGPTALAAVRSLCNVKEIDPADQATIGTIATLAANHFRRPGVRGIAKAILEGGLGDRWYTSWARTFSAPLHGRVRPLLLVRPPQVQPGEDPDLAAVHHGATVRFRITAGPAKEVGWSIGAHASACTAARSTEAGVAALLTRQLAARPAVDEVFGREVVGAYVRQHIRHFGEPMALASVPDVLAGRPSAQRKSMQDAWDVQQRAAGMDPWLSICDNSHLHTVKSFQKSEVGGNRARNISSYEWTTAIAMLRGTYPHDHAMTAARDAWIADPTAEVSDHSKHVVKGLMPSDIGPYLSLLAEREYADWISDGLLFDVDFSQFDGSIHAGLLEGQHLMFDTLLPELRAPMKRLMNARHTWKGKTQFGVTYTHDATRRSGSSDTSSGNALIQRAVVTHVLRTVVQRSDVRWDPRHVMYVVEGDDGFGCINPACVQSQADFAEQFTAEMLRAFGLTVKFSFKGIGDVVEFCGMTIVRGEWAPLGAERSDPRVGGDRPYHPGELTPACRCGGCGLCMSSARPSVVACGQRRIMVSADGQIPPDGTLTVTGVRYNFTTDRAARAIVVDERAFNSIAHHFSWSADAVPLARAGQEPEAWMNIGHTVANAIHAPTPVVGPRVYHLLHNPPVMFYSIPKLDRCIPKLTTTSSELYTCPHHTDIVDSACPKCRKSHLCALLMLRARALCLLAQGVSLPSLQYYCSMILARTDYLATSLGKDQVSSVLSAVWRTEDRKKFHHLGLSIDDLMGGGTTWVRTALSICWVGGWEEEVRQGLTPPEFRDWVDRLDRAIVGRLPIAPAYSTAPPALKPGVELTPPGVHLEFSAEWWNMAMDQLSGRRVAPPPPAEPEAPAPPPADPAGGRGAGRAPARAPAGRAGGRGGGRNGGRAGAWRRVPAAGRGAPL